MSNCNLTQSQDRAPSSNRDACNFDKACKHLVVLSVNLSQKACYTAGKLKKSPPGQGAKGHYLLPVIASRELPVSTPRNALPADAQAPIWNRLLTWVLLITLLYFVSNGNPFPASGDVSFRVAEASGSSPSHRITVALMAILWVVLIFNRLPSVFAIAQRNKLIVALPLLALLSSVWSQNPRHRQPCVQQAND